MHGTPTHLLKWPKSGAMAHQMTGEDMEQQETFLIADRKIISGRFFKS